MNWGRALTVAGLCALAVQPSRAALTLSSLDDYTQNFNTLASTGTNNPFTNDSTIPGWYWQNTASDGGYDASDGSATSSPVRYSYGSTGSSERAMGAIVNNNHSVAMGIVFFNNTGQDIISIDVEYYGEQWRRNAANGDTIAFSYRTSASDITDFIPGSGAVPSGWTGESNLTFAQIHSGNGAALDGNDAANRTLKTAAISVSVPSGQYLALRWFDGDIANANDPGMAIDDVRVSFVAAAIPEPGAFLFGLWIASLIGVRFTWHRRRR